MKYLKESKIKVEKWSDLSGWSRSEMWENFDKLPDDVQKRVANVLNVLEEYGLCILDISAGKFFTNGTPPHSQIFDDERNLTEYRIKLGKIISTKDVEDNWGVSTKEEYIEKHGEDIDLDDFMNDLGKVGTTSEIHDEKLEFSVFAEKLPTNDMSSELKAYIISKALSYLAMLVLHVKDPVIFGSLDYYDMLHSHVSDMKSAFKYKKQKVSVDNMECVPELAYRFYADNKFFVELRDHMGESVMKSMILDIYKNFK